ncbi:MAG: phospholipase [Labilithrix sp.]|nr:phospholipase [Labilithrix sp.]
MDRIFTDATTWRTYERASSALLVDGRDYYRAFYEAALGAKRSICLLGWQFDSDVLLLRGDDLPAGADPRDFELMPFLDRLCRERPELEVRVLAWDHSVVFTFEREVLQQIVFDLSTCERFTFRYDDTVPLGGSHHQKVAIVDGRIAFLGSQDICHARWDSSAHLLRDPRRQSRFGIAYKPYHEVQAVVAGAPARSLLELFVERWRNATGQALDVASLVRDAGGEVLDVPVTLSMPRATVALSRTTPAGDAREPAREVRELHVRAIARAERLIYVETQYLTSCTVRDALLERMSDRSRPRLEVVIVMPHRPQKLKEELTVGPGQSDVLEALAAAAAAGGHALGVYNVALTDEEGRDVYVYIHSKLMIVDDAFFTVGSANLANRSMLVDSEINLSWCAEDAELRRAIRRARVRLMLEHLGEGADASVVVRPEGMVARLDALVDARRGRLRRRPVDHQEPGVIAKAMHEIVCDYVDPEDRAGDVTDDAVRAD